MQVLGDATVKIDRRSGGYTLEAAVPLATLGFDPKPGKQYRIDLGVIFSDANGTNRAQRMYWADKATGLVNDVPGEIMPAPNLWGSATLNTSKKD
ncbi:MAG: sugar-binding protein [Planctomycetota bacterium]